MKSILRLMTSVACALLLAGTSISPALSQDQPNVLYKKSLRQQQAVLFEKVRAEPQNLDAMFAYAGVSARLEDYEAAISTLERMLIFNKNLPRVRLELGVLYFRIGAYSVAERYFQSVSNLPDLPSTVSQRVDAYLVEIADRQKTHRFGGRAEFAIIADSNANLGPSDRSVLLFGLPARLDDASVENDDIGGRVLLELSHVYDLQRTNNDVWRTDAAYLGRRYESEDQGNLDSFFLRTGPELSLDVLTFGSKLKPFIDAEYVRADDQSLYRGAGGGFQFRGTPADEWSVFGELRGGYRDYNLRDDEDGFVALSRLGVGWLPGRDTIVTATITGQRDEADEDYNSNSEVAVRLSASFAYDPGFSFADDKWVLSGYVGAGWRLFDDPDPVVSGTSSRRDYEFRAGINHVYNFKSGFYGSIGATALLRDSNLPNFDFENLGVSASVGYRF